MSRSKWKFKYLSKEKLFEKSKIWDKNMLISDKLTDKTPLVYNGKGFFKVYVDTLKFGYKVGQFIYTRRYVNKNNIKKNSKTKTKK